MWLGQERAFDLGRTQGDVTDDLAGRGIADYVGAGDAGRVVRPGSLTEPVVERVTTAVEAAAVVGLGERSRRRYRCHVGALVASSLSAGINSAGRLTQASKASQSLAGMVTMRRSSISHSAASTALRRTKSLRLV